jgi:hypothetical protein
MDFTVGSFEATLTVSGLCGYIGLTPSYNLGFFFAFLARKFGFPPQVAFAKKP